MPLLAANCFASEFGSKPNIDQPWFLASTKKSPVPHPISNNLPLLFCSLLSNETLPLIAFRFTK